MSHGPGGLGGGALLSACTGAAAVDMTPMSATASAQRADRLLRFAPPLRFCCLLGSWLTPTGKRLIARPLPRRSRCWQAAGVETRRVPHALLSTDPHGRRHPPVARMRSLALT